MRGLNRHAYALNNPVAFVDPDGHNPVIIIVAIAAAGAAGVAIYEYATQGEVHPRDVAGVFAGGLVVGGLLYYAGPAVAGATVKSLVIVSVAGVEGELVSKFISGRQVTVDSLSGTVFWSALGLGALHVAAPGLFGAASRSPSGARAPPVTDPAPGEGASAGESDIVFRAPRSEPYSGPSNPAAAKTPRQRRVRDGGSVGGNLAASTRLDEARARGGEHRRQA